MVWVTADLQNICWCAVGSKASRNGKLPVARLTAVLAGQQTPVFLRRKGRPNRDAASFSLVFGDDRTLDLEVKEHTHRLPWMMVMLTTTTTNQVEVLGERLRRGCHFAEIHARDTWVDAFRYLQARRRASSSFAASAGAFTAAAAHASTGEHGGER